MQSLLSLPPRTGDPTRDLESLYKYVADLKFYLEGVLSDDTEQNLGGIGGDAKIVSDLVIPPIDFGAPVIPTGLTAIGLYQAIGLTWQIVMDPTIAGYEIQRSDDLTFTTNVKVLTRAKALHFIDQPLGNGVTKFYRIQALRGTTTLTPSGYSAVVSATTTAASTAIEQLEKYGAALQSLHLKEAIIGSAQIGDAVIGTANIADGAITTAKIALAAITTALIQDLAVSSAKINDLAVITGKIADLAVVEAKIGDLAVNTAKIRDLAVSEAKLANLSVSNAKIQAAAVDTLQVKDGAIDTAKIKTAAITSALIQDAAITSAKIQDGSITSADIGTAQIGTAHIQDGSITTAKIGAAQIGSAQIADASITSADIASLEAGKITSGTITTALIDIASAFNTPPFVRIAGADINPTCPHMSVADHVGQLRVLIGNLYAVYGGGLHYGLVVINAAGQMQFNTDDGGILAEGIKDAAVGAAKVATGAIINSKLADGSVTTAKIQDLQVTGAKIVDGAITNAKIGTAEITDAKIASLSASKITTGNLNATGGVMVGTGSLGAAATIGLIGQAAGGTGAPHIAISDANGQLRVLLGNLSNVGTGGAAGYGLIVWNSTGQQQYNTQNGGAQNPGIGSGQVGTGNIAVGAISQITNVGGLSNTNLTGSDQNVASVSMTTTGGVIHITATAVVYTMAASTASAMIANLRIVSNTTGANGPTMQFQMPQGVTAVAVTIPLTFAEGTTPGTHTWVIKANQTGATGGGFFRVTVTGALVTEFKR